MSTYVVDENLGVSQLGVSKLGTGQNGTWASKRGSVDYLNAS